MECGQSYKILRTPTIFAAVLGKKQHQMDGMKQITTAAGLSARIAEARTAGKRIGFVPTMGALHAGHMALIRRCASENELVVASIFVNPTQFNEAADLMAYPRTPDADARLLREHGCHLLYLPEIDDIYPNGTDENLAAGVDFGPLTTVMEGANRPGHFDGVAQVVSRLLDIVRPDTLYLGQKDYQQVAVVREMIRQLDLRVRVRTVPTVREADGLALSSRNRRLSDPERRIAGGINRQLTAVVSGLRAGWPARKLETLAIDHLSATSGLDPEYVCVFHGDTLQPYTDGEAIRELVVATAVRVGPVRLIDNRIVYPED